MGAATPFATEYVWPKTLRLPARPPKLVYLDLLHWVSLAKANSGHRDGGRYAEVLRACVRAVEGGVAVFPISDAIYMEVSKIGSTVSGATYARSSSWSRSTASSPRA